jgi:uncharacterized integral membrane protein
MALLRCGEKYMRWKLYLAAVLLLLLLTFVAQNSQTVNFDFLFWTFGLPRALMLLVIFLAGVATGLLLVAGRGYRRASHKHRTQTNTPPSP